MTDRFNALTVVLKHDTREDDAQAIINAIKQLQGVLDVTGEVADISQDVAETRARLDILQKLTDVCMKR